MKKTYIVVIVLVVIIGVLFFVFRSKKLEAPVVTEQNQVGNINTNGNDLIVPPVTTTVNTGTKVSVPVVKNFTVSGQNFSFTPNSITVKKGDKVKITFKNINGNHNFIIDEFSVNTGIIQSGTEKSVEFIADKMGSFQYYCSVGSHRANGMWGTLKVE